MIKTAVALSAVLAAGSAGALAQEQIAPPAINGTIQSIDSGARTIVLGNGQTYVLGDSADLGSLQAGAEVDLSCDTNGSNCMVVTSDMQNDVGPESGTEPGAGAGDTVPPDSSGISPDGGMGESGGSN